MSDAEYCTVEDVFRYALPSDALVRRALFVDSVDTTANTLSVGGHGCSTDDPIEFRVEPGGSLPSPISASTVYYAKPVTDSDDLLQVAATAGGIAIDLTTTGTGVDLVPSIRPTIHGAIKAVSQWIDNRIPAHAAPLTPDGSGNYPQVVRQMCAILACEMTLTVLGQVNTQLSAAADRMRADARMMLDGLPLRQVPAERGITPAFGNHHGERRGLLP